MPARQQIQKIQGLGVRLLDRLRALRMTQSELAKKTGLSRQTIHRAIHQDEVSGRVAKRIANAVGTDLLRSTTLAGGAPAVARETGSTHSAQGIISGPQATLTPFGAVLELLREDYGTSQEEVASEAGISLSTYRRLITGKTEPKDKWLLEWAESFEFRDPKSLLHLKHFNGTTDPLHRALGLQLRTWRASAGLDLIDAADAIGEDAVEVAELEIGSDEVMTFLDDLAALYGTTGDVIFRAAQLALPLAQQELDHVHVERILTFEAAQREGRERQDRREKERRNGGWDLEIAFELGDMRRRAGFDVKDVAERIDRSTSLVELWEEGDVEPTAQDFERMALIYRTTPWRLRYGTAWSQAWEFPGAWESRSLIFGASLTAEQRSWLYALLAELARVGLSDTELETVRESLTNPDRYYDVQFASSEEERLAFMHAKLREHGEEIWRNICDVGWTERPRETWSPLPDLFSEPDFDRKAAAALIESLGMRRAQAAAERIGQAFRSVTTGDGSEERTDADRDPPPTRAPLLTSPVMVRASLLRDERDQASADTPANEHK